MLTFEEYRQYDMLGLAGLVRAGDISAAELLEVAIAAIDRINPRINAVNRDMRDEARAMVQAGVPAGPLSGVPYLVKDLVSLCQGQPVGAGNRLLQTVLSPVDSEMVRRMRAAGLVILGRTATPELGLAPFTEPEVSGPVANPWDPARTPGGSSGGSAAAVAAGIVPAASGGDGGGSIRIPASCCGVFGLKPSRGRNPSGPVHGVPWHGLVQEHALTRTVRDSAALLDATQGADAGAPYVAPAPAMPFLSEVGRDPGRLRIAVTAGALMGDGQASPVSRAALDDAAGLLAGLGHHVETVRVPVDAEGARRAYFAVVAGETWANIREICAAAGVKPAMRHFEPATWMLGLVGKGQRGADFVAATRVFDLLTRQMGQFFESWDILLTPTMADVPHLTGALQPDVVNLAMTKLFGRPGWGVPPWATGQIDREARRMAAVMPYTALFNVTGQPAMSLPLFRSADGLPVGVQCVARYGEDATLFRLAAQLEAARPWAGRFPDIS